MNNIEKNILDKEVIDEFIKKFVEESKLYKSINISSLNLNEYATKQFNVIEENSRIPDIEVAKHIDHTALKPETMLDDIIKLCSEASEYNFATVCVNPSYVKTCAKLLEGTKVKVCTVIGFPLGATTTKSKVYEAEDAIMNGATEIDMVINVGYVKSKDYNYVYEDIRDVAAAAKKQNAILKVIIETALLSIEEKVNVCIISRLAGADFVKTSTGFSKSGATIEDIALMKYVVGDNVKVKASGGIRTRKFAEQLLLNGADRIGASASIEILKDKIS